MNNSTGFSLFEILVTVLLIGIIAAIMIPSQKCFLQSSNAKIAGAQLFHAIEVTRSEAILNGKTVTLSKTGEWYSGYVIKLDNKILYSFKNSFSDGIIYWRAFPSNQKDINFLASGYSAAQNGTFWFCYKGRQTPEWAIVLNQGGRARMVYPDRRGKIYDGNEIVIKC